MENCVEGGLAQARDLLAETSSEKVRNTVHVDSQLRQPSTTDGQYHGPLVGKVFTKMTFEH